MEYVWLVLGGFALWFLWTVTFLEVKIKEGAEPFKFDAVDDFKSTDTGNVDFWGAV